MAKGNQPIARHKAAIRRTDLSLPTKCVIRDGLLEQDATFFDYGCGHGEDVHQLSEMGFHGDGWDPVFRPHAERQSANVVNLGYVLNVIEDVDERAETLRSAWQLAEKLLTVAARIVVSGNDGAETEYGDGVLTRIGTFQKYYTQAELREYIEAVLEVEASPAAPGVFYVFRDDDLRQRFLATRYRRRLTTPRRSVSEIRFEENKELLEPLMEAITEFGRVPEADEFLLANETVERFGSLKRAFSLIRRVTGNEQWEEIRHGRAEDLSVYLAMANFRRRPKLSQLPPRLRRDVREFFRTYKRACEAADELLFAAGDAEAIDAACQHSKIGRLSSNALFVHRDAIGELEPLLRIYEGCARAYLGEIDTASVVKLHRFSGKVSYLSCPEFDSAAHPRVARTVKLSLRNLRLDCYDNTQSDNPVLLDRKESMVGADYPGRDKFARLTRQEEKQGLLDESTDILNRQQWRTRLELLGFEHRGHRLVRRKGR